MGKRWGDVWMEEGRGYSDQTYLGEGGRSPEGRRWRRKDQEERRKRGGGFEEVS